MSLEPDALADPTGSVIRQFNITDEKQIDLIRKWGELCAAKLRGDPIDIRYGQSKAHPLAEELLLTFGLTVTSIRDTLHMNHRASYEAALIRQGVG